MTADGGPELIQLLTPEGERVHHPEYDVDLTPDELRALYRDLVLVRRVDAEATALQRQGELGPSRVLSRGEGEAVCPATGGESPDRADLGVEPDTLTGELVGYRLHTRSAHTDTGTNRIHTRIVALHRDLGTHARIARSRNDFDQVLPDFRNFELE